MTQEQYDKSIETGELQLSFWQKVSHFGIVAYLLFIPIALSFTHLFEYLKDGSVSILNDEPYIFVIPLVLGLLFYWLQKSRLKFKVLVTKLNKEEMVGYITLLCKEWDWAPYFHNKYIFIAKTKRGFFSGSWGEQVTILFDKNKILVNSICDPDKRSSVVSMGNNHQNVKAITDMIDNINHLTKPS